MLKQRDGDAEISKAETPPKGGKEHEMPVHHLLEEILNEYIVAAALQSGTPCSRALIHLERQ
jgi:hypothetical protein